MKSLALALRVASLAGFCALAGAAHAQAIQPQAPGTQTPGFQSLPASTGQPAAAPSEVKIVKSEVERKGRIGFDTFLSTYLTLSKECKVGANPKVEVTTPPKNGKINIRPNAINLRAVPGAPKTNCIGTSPYGVGVFYRAERRFKGEDTFVYRVVYPTGDVREVSAKVVIQ
ncbi:MAG: hypothetical protein CFE31_08965 [Rhizobiales bacterium PAR1]|nr:MAG: hypothetical protein CFE31_08965 [Rhizobiales bacterium PAR1]